MFGGRRRRVRLEGFFFFRNVLFCLYTFTGVLIGEIFRYINKLNLWVTLRGWLDFLLLGSSYCS
jgi:hypothetical protein